MALPNTYQPNITTHTLPPCPRHRSRQKVILVLLMVLLLTTPLAPLAIGKAKQSKQTSMLSPLATTAGIETEEAVKKVYSMQYYLSLSDSFMQKATRLANDDPYQTEEERLIIINQLNQALKAANSAVNFYPQSAEAYLARADIYQKIQHLYPEAAQAAQQDLSIAKDIIAQTGSNNVPTPNEQSNETSASPMEYIPTQKASLAQNITIATDSNAVLPDPNQVEPETNARADEAVLPAGMTKTKVYVPELGEDMVYVVPADKSQNITLSVGAKKANAWFEVMADQAPATDLKFQWWIIKTNSNERSSLDQVQPAKIFDPKSTG